MIKARVHKSDRQDFYLKIVETGQEVVAKAKGNILKQSEIVVGDFVLVEENNDEYVIHEVCERKNEIFRMLIREKKKKVTAANVDYLVIVSTVSKPAYKQGLIDRYLIRAAQWNITPLVIFNKIDEFNPKKQKVDMEFEKSRFEFAGVKCFEISAVDKNLEPIFGSGSFNDLLETLKGTTSIFLGQSGVGKSKTITALSDGEINLRSEKLAKVGKGAHTTTWSEIVETDELTLIDSPGIRSYSLNDIEKEELICLFPDLEETSLHCEFKDCNHDENSKGCAFHSEKQKASKDYPYIVSRLASYHKILDEILKIPEWQK